MDPLITVLINTYNYARFIGRAIDSVLEQRYPESRLEILVLDDGSTDGTESVVRRYGEQVRYRWKERSGQASALNLGFREARGEIVCLLDADDYFLPEKLRLVADVARRHPQTGLIYNEFDIVLGDGRSLGKTFPEPTWTGCIVPLSRLPQQIQSLIVLGHPWTCITSAMSIRRSVMNDLEIPQDVFPHSPDLFLGIVLPFLTPVEVIEKPLTAYVFHGENVGLFRSSASNRETFERQMAYLRNLAQDRFGVRFHSCLGRSVYYGESGKLPPGTSRFAQYRQERREIAAAQVDRAVKRRSQFKLAAAFLLPRPAYETVRRVRAAYLRQRSKGLRRSLGEARQSVRTATREPAVPSGGARRESARLANQRREPTR